MPVSDEGRPAEHVCARNSQAGLEKDEMEKHQNFNNSFSETAKPARTKLKW